MTKPSFLKESITERTSMTEEIRKQRALVAQRHHELYQAKIHGEGLAKIEKLRRRMMAEEKKLNRLLFVAAQKGD